MSAWCGVRPPERPAHAVLPVLAAGHDRPRRDAEPARLDRLPDVHERVADDQRVRRRPVHAVPHPRCAPPWIRRPDGRPAHPAGDPTPGRTLRRSRPDRLPRRGIRRRRPRSEDHPPTPARRVPRRGGPRRRCGWPAPPWPWHPVRRRIRTRYACDGGAARRGAVRITGLPSIRYPGPTGNGFLRPCLSSSSIRPYSIRTTAPT